jgi:uncharacterized protein (DUF488 family)
VNAPSARQPIFTIGHSTHSVGRFVELLRMHQVTEVADVRSVPYSRFTPHFNRGAIESSLRREGVDYVYAGRELGARRDEPECFEGGQAKYERIALLPRFREGIERLSHAAATRRVALMCAEKDPITCHRTVLVARALLRAGLEVRHILEDGRIESAAEAEERILDAAGMPRVDLFQSRQELVDAAYRALGERMAWVVEIGE